MPKSTGMSSCSSCAIVAGDSNPSPSPVIDRASPIRSEGEWPACGGSVAIRSSPGHGTEVELSMPRRDRSSERTSADPGSFWSTTTPCSGPGSGPSWATRSRSSGEADEVDAAVEMINERLPDVVLLDVHLPGGGGQAVLGGSRPHHPEVRFLALSVSDAPEDVIAVIRAGARGYVTKTISGEELLQAVYRVDGGRRGVLAPPGRLRPRRLCRKRRSGPWSAGLDPELDQLSPREGEVLRLIARGYTYKEVARDLTISAKTVESHVSSVLRKLQLSTRHELTKWATDRRLV